MDRRIECAVCDRELTESDDREPCPHCGALERRHLISVSDHAGVTDEITQLIHTPSNEALAKRLQFDAAVGALEAAVGRKDAHAAQYALKHVLETLHELNDLAVAGSWSQAAWTGIEREIWAAHVAARNVAHHQTASVLALDTMSSPEDRARWAIDGNALAALRSPFGRQEFQLHLSGRPVLAPLGLISIALDRSIS